MTRPFKYSSKTPSRTLKYFILFILCYFKFFDVSSQCIPVKWIDWELNSHSGPYLLSGFPDTKYSYLNYDYKSNKVAKATVYNEKKNIISEKEFDSTGYLISEMRFDHNGNQEFHKFRYQNNNLIIIDSIRHIMVGLDTITQNALKPIKKDTVLHIEKRKYNSDNRLISSYSFFFDRFYRSILKSSDFFYVDSLFYNYDSCGNCNKITWYNFGVKEERSILYGYPDFKYYAPGDDFIIQSGNSQVEHWKFNLDSQITQITADNLGSLIDIVIEYNKSKKIKRYELLDPSLYSLTCTYIYDTNGNLIQMRIQFKDSPAFTRNITRYKNGLIQTNTSGNLVRYIYRK